MEVQPDNGSDPRGKTLCVVFHLAFLLVLLSHMTIHNRTPLKFALLIELCSSAVSDTWYANLVTPSYDK